MLVPERPGHGATGGKYLEDQGGCDEADYSRAGYATADSIKAALGYLRGQPFIRPDGAVVVGHSAGAWGALALAAEDPKVIATIIAFAPGRGGDANDAPHQVCAPHTLIASAAEFAEDARVPVLWLVAANDSYFTPELSRQWPTLSAPPAERSTSACCRPPAARGTGWPEFDSGEKIFGPVLDGAIKTAMAKPAAGKKR